jgi:hypothetical protein
MANITYDRSTVAGIPVKLDGRRVGTIRNVRDGWQYQPTGSRHMGEVFLTVNECKRSIEAE